MVDGVRLPVIGAAGTAGVVAAAGRRAGDRGGRQSGAGRSGDRPVATIVAAILVGFAGATYDIVIDAYRIETLEPYQLGVGIRHDAIWLEDRVASRRDRWRWCWRHGSAGTSAYLACIVFALPAMIVALVRGEPTAPPRAGDAARREPRSIASIVGPFSEFFRRHGALVILLFILVHKIGDTLGQQALRLLLDDLGFTNDEIAIYDVGDRLLGVLDRAVHRRRAVRAAGAEAIGADQPGADGGVERQLRAAGGGGAQQRRAGGRRWRSRTSRAGSAG